MQPGPDPSKSRHHAGDDVKELASRHENRPTSPEKEASTQFAAKLLLFFFFFFFHRSSSRKQQESRQKIPTETRGRSSEESESHEQGLWKHELLKVEVQQ